MSLRYWNLTTQGAMEKRVRIKQLTLRLPEELHREFKVSAAKKGQSMGEVAVALIKKYLDEDAAPM